MPRSLQTRVSRKAGPDPEFGVRRANRQIRVSHGWPSRAGPDIRCQSRRAWAARRALALLVEGMRSLQEGLELGDGELVESVCGAVDEALLDQPGAGWGDALGAGAAE